MSTAQAIRSNLAITYHGGGTALFRGVDTTGGQVLVEGVGGVNRCQYVRNDDGADIAHVSGWSKTTGGAFVEVARVALATRSAANGAGEIALSVKAPAGVLTTTLMLDEKLSVVLGAGALATTATDGFVYVPTMPGTPSGVPTAHTGRAPVAVDDSANKLWFYAGGAWREASGGGDAQYLTLAASAALPNERVFTPAAGVLSATDGGAGAAYTLTIATAGVTSAMLRNSAGNSVIGNVSGSAGVPGDIVAGSDGHYLRRFSGNIGFGVIADADLPGTIMRTSAISIAAGQVAYATGANAIGGSTRLTWNNTNANLTLSGATAVEGRVLAGDGSVGSPTFAFGTAPGLGFYKGGTSIVAMSANLQFGTDGAGMIIDALGFRRVGFMKYGGREGGIWCATSQDFEIGQVDTADLLTATVYNVRMRMSGVGRFKIGAGTVDARDALELDSGGLLLSGAATVITAGAGMSVYYGGGSGYFSSRSNWATSTFAPVTFETSEFLIRTAVSGSPITRLTFSSAGAMMLSNGSAGVSALQEGGFRYNESTHKLQWAQNGSAWANLDAFSPVHTSGRIVYGSGTGITSSADFTWSSNNLLLSNGAGSYMQLSALGSLDVLANGEPHFRYSLARSYFSSQYPALVFGSGTATPVTSGAAIGLTAERQLTLLASNGVGLIQIARLEVLSAPTISRLLLIGTAPQLSLGNDATIGFPSDSYANWKLLLRNTTVPSTSYGVGLETNNLWLHSGGTGLKFYIAGVQRFHWDLDGTYGRLTSGGGLTLKGWSDDLADLKFESQSGAMRAIRLENRGGTIAGTPEFQIGPWGGASLFVADARMIFRSNGGSGGTVGFFSNGSFGGGNGVISIANRTTAPTSNPSGGVIEYAEGGKKICLREDGVTVQVA